MAIPTELLWVSSHLSEISDLVNSNGQPLQIPDDAPRSEFSEAIYLVISRMFISLTPQFSFSSE
jgi:hypothetical protein